MCGIFGLLSSTNSLNELNLRNIINSMNHRGPDHSGSWVNKNRNLLFAHTRLSILDLSNKGCQPMHSSSGRFTIVYNGEIYNHQKLRKIINNTSKNIYWKSNSDTETLLELFEIYGVEKTLDSIEGMFAFGVWDNKFNELTLARDRIGEKPLYFGLVEKDFIFSSEIKSIKQHPKFLKDISAEALNYYFAYNYIKAPYSIYKNIFKLQPGSILKLNHDELHNLKNQNSQKNLIENFRIKKWWSVYEAYTKNDNIIKSSSLEKNSFELEKLLNQSIQTQMISDVPIGCFLSGGIDSTLISLLMQKISRSKLKTFTIGFDDSNFNESIYAKRIANFIGTDHTEMILKPKDISDIIIQMYKIYDEPFSDSSQIPTFFVSKLARNQVKVALSGDGGDELFGGYNRYLWVSSVWKLISIVPFNVRKVLGYFLSTTPEKFWNFFEQIFQSTLNIKMLDNKIKKLANRLKYVKSFEDLYFSLVVEFRPEDNILINKIILNLQFDEDLKRLNLANVEKMMVQDKISYLPDDIMCKIDRASMHHSLETRAPFLNSEILYFSSQLPTFQKIIKNKGKIILREILNRYIPGKYFERPKMGFGMPLDSWLRRDLKDWVFDTLCEKKISEQGYLNAKLIKKLLYEHYSNKRQWGNKIWSILMFQSWMDNQ
jgi:asparagine synthase (glutamine-hydrolysing)